MCVRWDSGLKGSRNGLIEEELVMKNWFATTVGSLCVVYVMDDDGFFEDCVCVCDHLDRDDWV